MNRSGLQRIVPIILVIIVIGLSIWAIVSIGRAVFGGGEASPSPTPEVNVGETALVETTAERSVRMTVRGPIVANEKFYSYSISISPDARNMTVYKGYSNEVAGSSQLQNTMAAYEQFVFAEQRANLMSGTPLKGEENDTRGVCATGLLYTFDVMQGTNVVQSLWTSTCAGSPGSLNANLAQVSNLFKVQIPQYDELNGTYILANT